MDASWSPSPRWALAAAFLFALSAFLQQRAARTIVGTDTASLRDAAGVKRLLSRLVRSPTWLAGWLTNLGGVGTQAAALKVGSVAAVQPMMAAQLLFVLSLASGEQRRWPSGRDWLSAFAVCAGLVLLVTADAVAADRRATPASRAAGDGGHGRPHCDAAADEPALGPVAGRSARRRGRRPVPRPQCRLPEADRRRPLPRRVIGHALRLACLRVGRHRGERNVVGTDSFCQRSAATRRRGHERHQPRRQFRSGHPRLRRARSPRPRRAVGHRGVGSADRGRYRRLGERIEHAPALPRPDTRTTPRPIHSQPSTLDADHGGYAI